MEESHRVIAEIIDNLVEPSLASQFPIIDLTEHLAELQIGLDVCMDADLALPWAELAGFDLELIEKTHDALKSENGTVLKSKLGHLIVLIKNHPIEYFLQTPNIMEVII